MRIIKLAFAALLVASPLAAQTEMARPVVQSNETILRVQGEGFVLAKPKRMSISIGVVTTAPTAAAALDANNRKLAPVIDALLSFGISPANIQTSSLEVDPQFSDDRSRTEDRIIGFRASNKVSVQTRELEKAGELISLLFDVGANSVDGPFFLVAEEDEEAIERKAETAALIEAREQAENVADALGMRVARVLLISDSDVQFSDGSGYIVVTGSRIAPTPIEPGEIKVDAT